MNMSEHEELRKLNSRIRVAVYMDEAAKEHRWLQKRKWALRQLVVCLAGTLGGLLLLAGLCGLQLMHIYLVATLALITIAACSGRIGYLWRWLKRR